MDPELFSAIFRSGIRYGDSLHDDRLMRLSDAKREFGGFVNWDEVSIYHNLNSNARWVRRGELIALREKRNLSKIICLEPRTNTKRNPK